MYDFTMELTDGDSDASYVIPWSIIILLCVLCCCLSMSALFGNSLVMWVITAAILQRWNLPNLMCTFCPFFQVLSINVNVFTLSVIALDRYKAVLHPLKPQIPKRRAFCVISAVWIMGILIALPTTLDYKVSRVNDTVNGGTKEFCNNVGLNKTFRVYYSFSLLVIQYVFPLLIISGAYARMATKLWGTEIPGNREESRDAIIQRNKRKVIEMLTVVVILFSVCWLPLQLYNVLQFFIPSITSYKYIKVISFCCHGLAMSNSCFNPFIYAMHNAKFQREVQTKMSYVCKPFGFGKDNTIKHIDAKASHCNGIRRKVQFVCKGRNLKSCVRNVLGVMRKRHITVRDRQETTVAFSQPNGDGENAKHVDIMYLHLSSTVQIVISSSQSTSGIGANEYI